MEPTSPVSSLRDRLEAHAKACRDAQATGRSRPPLSEELVKELLRGCCANLAGANLTGANLTGVNLTRANLTHANLTRANLTGVNLTRANLADASLDGANLTRANLAGANLAGANLTGVNLADASLDSASLDGANLTGASLDGANLTGADLGKFKLLNGYVRSITGGRYAALTVSTDAGRVLRFGCETHTLSDWRQNVRALCQKHAPDQVDQFEREILALVAWCETL